LRQESEKAHTKVIVSHDWQRAITHIQPLETGKDWTRILCTIETGRMHQIRVHCAHVCHPIFWDKRYGSEVKHRATRQLLHAYSLEFRHPFTGKNILCIAPFFPDFKPYVQDSRALFCGGFKDEIARDL
jgi:23S rRNA pseudouridine1911/1915/1917 synthase